MFIKFIETKAVYCKTEYYEIAINRCYLYHIQHTCVYIYNNLTKAITPFCLLNNKLYISSNVEYNRHRAESILTSYKYIHIDIQVNICCISPI